jgi:hypothetical protein
MMSRKAEIKQDKRSIPRLIKQTVEQNLQSEHARKWIGHAHKQAANHCKEMGYDPEDVEILALIIEESMKHAERVVRQKYLRDFKSVKLAFVGNEHDNRKVST